MTTVWRIHFNATDFNSLSNRPSILDGNTLSSRHERYGTFPQVVGTPQLETWEPQRVWYHPLDFQEDKGLANFPGWDAAAIVCDLNTQAIIRKLIEDHVEFLPLVYYEGFADKEIDSKYFAINVLQILDCLDYERCEFTRFKSTGGIRSVRTFEFKPDCIGGIPIFKLPILRSIRTYVTDEFKQLVEDNNLTGLEFSKVWRK